MLNKLCQIKETMKKMLDVMQYAVYIIIFMSLYCQSTNFQQFDLTLLNSQKSAAKEKIKKKVKNNEKVKNDNEIKNQSFFLLFVLLVQSV